MKESKSKKPLEALKNPMPKLTNINAHTRSYMYENEEEEHNY